MTMRGIRLFPIGLIVLTGALASAQTSQTNAVQNPQTKAVNAAEVAPEPAEAAPAPEPVYPKRPVELPAKPPKVTCKGDQITISADNSTLEAILAAVRGCTGAKIDMPAGAGQIRSFEELGPGPVRQVLDDLLSGTPYNYVIQSSEANPLRVEQVMLSMRTKDGEKPGSGPASEAISTDIPMTAGRRAWKLMQKFDKPDPSTLDGDTPAVADAATPADEAAATADSNAASGSANSGEPTQAAATPPPPPTPVAAPIDANSGGDPAKVVQDRIAAMQQMFNQRQQMIKSQNQSQSGAPNN
jgi:hypothetical protein